jgi:hypothetical protein
MPKKKASDAKLESLKRSIEDLGLGGNREPRPWSGRKEKAKSAAEKAGFSVERILFGWSLENQVAYSVERAIQAHEHLFPAKTTDSFLATIAGDVARSLGLAFKDCNDITLQDEAVELALSCLYLFPRLWEALDKPLTLKAIKALDFDELLSRRHKPRQPSS